VLTVLQPLSKRASDGWCQNPSSKPLIYRGKSPVRSGMRVLVVRLEANSGPATARNAGLCVARRLGVQLVCFLDADCLPEVRVARVSTSWPRRRA